MCKEWIEIDFPDTETKYTATVAITEVCTNMIHI